MNELEELNKKIDELEKQINPLYNKRNKIESKHKIEEMKKQVGKYLIYRNNTVVGLKHDVERWNVYIKVVGVEDGKFLTDKFQIFENKYPRINREFYFNLKSHEEISKKTFEKGRDKVLKMLGLKVIG